MTGGTIRENGGSERELMYCFMSKADQNVYYVGSDDFVYYFVTSIIQLY